MLNIYLAWNTFVTPPGLLRPSVRAFVKWLKRKATTETGVCA